MLQKLSIFAVLEILLKILNLQQIFRIVKMSMKILYLHWVEITPQLRKFPSDRTPHTWTMTPLNIGGMVFLCPMTGLLSSGLLPSGLISSELTTHRQSIPSADPCKGWLSSMDLVILAQPLALITVEEMWRMQWKRQNNRTLKETRCHLWKIVFKELGSV